MGVHRVEQGLAWTRDGPQGRPARFVGPHPSLLLLLGRGGAGGVVRRGGRVGVHGQDEAIQGQGQQLGHGAQLLAGNHAHGRYAGSDRGRGGNLASKAWRAAGSIASYTAVPHGRGRLPRLRPTRRRIREASQSSSLSVGSVRRAGAAVTALGSSVRQTRGAKVRHVRGEDASTCRHQTVPTHTSTAGACAVTGACDADCADPRSAQARARTVR